MRPVSLLRAALGGLALLAFAPSAHAQFRALGQDAIFSTPSPVRLAQGNAYVAAPSRETALFGNPAHLSYLGGRLPKVNLGLMASVGGNVREAYDFYNQQLGPAIEEGLDEIRTNDPNRLQTLYDDALRIGASQKTARAGADLTGTVTVGDIGIGGGVIGTGVTRAQMLNGGAGVPYIDLYSQADLLIPVAASYRLHGPAMGALAAISGVPSSIAGGIEIAYGRRWLTAKSGTVDAFDPDGEKLYLFTGSAVSVGLGLQAEDVGLPGIDVGLAVRNLFGSEVALELDRSWDVSGSDGQPDDPAEIAAIEQRFAQRGAAPAVRAGVSYRLPIPVTEIADARVSADYTNRSTSEYDQSFQAGLRLGAQATVIRMLDLRAGVSQGLPSVGAGLRLPGFRIDYATYGVEDGALLGQLPRRAHMLQLRFGIY